MTIELTKNVWNFKINVLLSFSASKDSRKKIRVQLAIALYNVLATKKIINYNMKKKISRFYNIHFTAYFIKYDLESRL